jgi:hypothetical protein
MISKDRAGTNSVGPAARVRKPREEYAPTDAARGRAGAATGTACPTARQSDVAESRFCSERIS